jgi:hypothetical protein
MNQLLLTVYTYKEHLDEVALRELTKRFGEVGEAPGTLAHYTRLDGRGGFTVAEATPEDQAKVFETLLSYAPWMTFEVIPVTTMAEALPSILKLYG